MKTLKTRHQFYLPDDLSDRLEDLAAKPGSSKTAILTDAFRDWLERRAGSELDERFGLRLDRFSRSQELVRQKPPFEAETGQLGLQRYQAFVEAVGRRLARPDRSPIRIEMTKLGSEENE